MELDFLDEPETPAAEETVAETPVAEAAPAAEEPATDTVEQPLEGQPRGADGKFLPKASDTPAVAAAEPAPQAPAPTPEAQQAPAADDRYAKLEAQVAGLTKALTATRQQNRQPAQPAPDHYTDPDGFKAWQEGAQLAERANWSRDVAILRHGEELVAKAQEWAAGRFESDPVYQQQAITTRDPFGLAVEQYQREQALQVLADPKVLEQFRAWQTGSSGAAPAPVAAPQGQHIPPRVEAPPQSIVTAPNAGGPAATPVGGGSAYDAALS